MQSFLVALIVAAIATQTGALPAPAMSSAAVVDGDPGVSAAAPTPTTVQVLPTPKPVNVCGFPVVPLYEAESASLSDRVITTNASEIEAALASGQYFRHRVLASVYSNTTGPTVPNAIALYELHNAAVNDHIITTSVQEMQGATEYDGYSYEGITAYVYPVPQGGCTEAVPLYRLYNAANKDHTYVFTMPVTNSSTGLTPDGYFYEGITGYVFPPQ